MPFPDFRKHKTTFGPVEFNRFYKADPSPELDRELQEINLKRARKELGEGARL